MKRTALKRGTKRLKTYSPLRRFTELRTSGLPRQASGELPEGGAPRSRSRGHRIAVDASKVVRTRSGGRCEIRQASCWGAATQMHHRITQKSGGRHGAAARRSDRPSNLLHVCFWCHDVVTKSPGASRIVGHSLLEGQDPAKQSVLYRGVLGYLDDVGGFHDFEKAGA